MRTLQLIIFLSFTFLNSLQGQIISYSVIDTFTTDSLKKIWKGYSIPKIVAPIKNDVVVYDIIYYTHWVDRKKIKASGLYFAPITNKEFPVLIYNHGTRIKPHRSNNIRGENLICTIFATDGYGVLAPDYIGLGHGEKKHLYCHADSEAEAGIDFLNIIDDFNKDKGLKRNNQIFISGYSQGGHSAMALHIKLQNEYSDKYPVTASSPMSGPYDLAHTQASVMFEEYTQPHYLPYLLIGMNAAYNIWPEKDFYNIFKYPYDSIIPTLFQGNHSYSDINEALPKVPKDMLNDKLVNEYINNPDFFFNNLMKKNSVHDWKAEAPVQLCYCEADEEVKYENAIVAHAKMKEKGTKHVKLKHVGKKFNHRQCAEYACIYTKFFFDSFRKGSKKGRKGPLHKRFLLSLAKMIR